MRRAGEGDDARLVGEERLQVLGVERAVLAHPPPAERRARLLELQPGRDVGVVIHVGDDDLVPLGPSVWPIARLTMRMNEVAFMPKQTSSGRAALIRIATLSRASATDWSTARLFS